MSRTAQELQQMVEQLHRELEVIRLEERNKTRQMREVKKELEALAQKAKDDVYAGRAQGPRRYLYVIKRRSEGADYPLIAEELGLSLKQIITAMHTACRYVAASNNPDINNRYFCGKEHRKTLLRFKPYTEFLSSKGYTRETREDMPDGWLP